MTFPPKRAVERFWLLYTPIWGVATGLVMLTGLAGEWGDAGLVIFGVAVAVPAVVGPIVTRPASERALPLHQTTAFKMMVSVVGLSFGLNYTQTPYFYDVLHMHYGFDVTIAIRNNPVFLYFMTVPYFATYCAVCLVAFRLIRSRAPRFRTAAWVIAPVAMAFLETLLNANPFMKRLFCYDDMSLMLWFGTLSYSVSFILVLPLWVAIDESETQRLSLFSVVVGLFAVLYADLLVLDGLRYLVAPHLTTVAEGANGLRDFTGSCLER